MCLINVKFPLINHKYVLIISYLTLMDNSGEDQELMYIYEWVDSVPLSRPKKNMGRDFADGGKTEVN
jgi:hypothetical protein